ncbi:MAG: diaminopimelate dehydrogenase [Ignavibacteriales bacterium]|nr:diaminopimelate dehydrogenase [Ignavibacteriales bacterium]
MTKYRVAIVGYGHVGECVLTSILESPDMELAGIVEVPPVVKSMCQLKPQQPSVLQNTHIVDDIKELGHVNVAVLCCPSRAVHRLAKIVLESGSNCIDAFDIHNEILTMRKKLDEIAKVNGNVSILSAGWDPGIDSVIRAWYEAMAPKGITYTNYGPGMSLGHTCAVKAIEGVEDALSMTIPTGSGIHRRAVYVQMKPDASFSAVELRIKEDGYFNGDETIVKQVECINSIMDMGHGVSIERKGVSGLSHNQMFKFDMRINNPALTAQIMVSAARASMKQKPGCYTMIELPACDFLYGNVESFIKKLV